MIVPEQGYFATKIIGLVTTEVLWLSSWSRGLILCIHLHNENRFVQCVIVILFSFVPDLTFYEQICGCFSKSRRRLPYPCTWSLLTFFRPVRVIHLRLFLCTYYFGSLCSVLCVSVFPVWTLSLNHIILISVRIMVPLITLLRCETDIMSLLWCKCMFPPFGNFFRSL